MTHLQIPGVNFVAVAPEVILAVGGLLILLIGSGLRQRGHLPLSIFSLAVVGAAVAVALFAFGRHESVFSGSIALDGFASMLKVTLLIAVAISILSSYTFLDRESNLSTEYLALLLFSTAGMIWMTSALDLLMAFIALETFSLGLYVLAAFRSNRSDSQEGALKYFLSGSFASAFFLYGVALVYGGSGSTRFASIADFVRHNGSNPMLLAGLAFILAGLSFKVSAVPFHMWTPDVYQGSPSPVAGFMAAGSKIAGFAVLLRLLTAVFGGLSLNWRPVLIAVALVSMVFGSLVAIAQTNIKRMLAYSAIAHTGFLLIGVVAASTRGISGAVFYLVSYSLVIVGCFAVSYAVGGTGEQRTSLQDYRGLWSRQPVAATCFAALLVSLAGIPPSAGFIAKFEVFSAGIAAGQTPIVVVAVLSSAVAAFFYLRVIVLMFLQDDPEWTAHPEPTPPMSGLAALIGVGLAVVFGVFPNILIALAREATLVLH